MTAAATLPASLSKRLVVRYDDLPTVIRVPDSIVLKHTDRLPADREHRCPAAIIVGMVPRNGLIARLIQAGVTIGAAYQCLQRRRADRPYCGRHLDVQTRHKEAPYAVSRRRWENEMMAMYGYVPSAFEQQREYERVRAAAVTAARIRRFQ